MNKAKGMGSLRLRGDIWYVDYHHQGRRFRERVGTSKTLAVQALNKRLTEIAEGKFFPERNKPSITFREMANLYWEHYAKTKKGARTTWPYVKKLSEVFGDKRLDQISILDITAYLNGLKANLSPAAVNRYHAFLSSIFYRAIDWEKFSGHNPASKVKKLQEDNKRLRYLSQEEMAALLKAAHPRLYPALVCAMMTGMRKSELLSLDWKNVDVERGFIYILKSKSGKKREIPVSSKLRQVLLSLGPKESGSVFELPEIMMRRYFDRALKEAGIRDFRWHDLRHTFASHFVMRTKDIPALQSILGHATAQMTQRYAHLANSHLAVNMEIFDAGMAAVKPQVHLEPSQIRPNVEKDLLNISLKVLNIN
ncbi:MAG: tyrosine-type recombinase/integrase [Elusimicrobia bacterium]|nr:tyrosine-type recombinase/integrase [Elusimicrobiota bacterium]